jgi:predicted Zn-dependent protease
MKKFNLLNIIILGLLVLIFSGFSTSVAANSPENPKQDEISKKYGFTIEEEKEIGFQSAIALIKKYGQYKNKAVNKYITGIGEDVARKISKRTEIKYRFIILDTDDVNAFAAPGGFIFITKGSIKILYNEAELAAILSHEIAHVENGNGLESISSDPQIKEKILLIKQTVNTKEGLNQNFENLLDSELNKADKKPLPVVNFDNVEELTNIKINNNK